MGTYTLTLQCAAGPATTPTPTPTVTPPAPTPTPIAGPCTANATTLCLNNGRFRVQAAYSTPAGQSGPGMAVTQTTDTGVFWFFSANNIEVIVKEEKREGKLPENFKVETALRLEPLHAAQKSAKRR